MNRLLVVGTALTTGVFSAGPSIQAYAAATHKCGNEFGELGLERVPLRAVGIVLESGLTTLFQWRLFREFFIVKALKTIVVFAAGYLVVG